MKLLIPGHIPGSFCEILFLLSHFPTPLSPETWVVTSAHDRIGSTLAQNDQVMETDETHYFAKPGVQRRPKCALRNTVTRRL